MRVGIAMSLETLFRAAVQELRNRHLTFAVAGGVAADLYRHETRLTMDVDLGILSDTDAVATAISVVESLGLEARVVREADLAGGPLFAIRQQRTAPYVVVGRPSGVPSGPGVDILLPALPWTPEAIRRAQVNDIDFGFGPVPTLALEDVIVAKLFALRAMPLRVKDLDDLQSIFQADHSIDMPYLAGQIRRFDIRVPRDARPFLPDWIVKMARAPGRG